MIISYEIYESAEGSFNKYHKMITHVKSSIYLLWRFIGEQFIPWYRNYYLTNFVYAQYGEYNWDILVPCWRKQYIYSLNAFTETPYNSEQMKWNVVYNPIPTPRNATSRDR